MWWESALNCRPRRILSASARERDEFEPSAFIEKSREKGHLGDSSEEKGWPECLYNPLRADWSPGDAKKSLLSGMRCRIRCKTRLSGESVLFAAGGSVWMDDEWNPDKANQLVRLTLNEIEQLAEKLSPARAEALLDEFEHDIHDAFLRQDLSAVMNNCEKYERRFRALGEEED